MKIKIDSNANIAVNSLCEKGFKAFAVGGCIRDCLLLKTPHDWDICTDAQPEDILRVFADYKVIETGIKHGTVCVIINSTPVEITTFRSDGDYCDNRHPSNVVFKSNIEDDLSRRDFTINALAYNENDGLVDCFNGIKDLDNKLIRCVGDADTRFKEDALRILRAVRFSSQLGFDIEDKTAQSIIKNKNLLLNISAERIREELLKLLMGDNVKNVLLKYRDVIGVIIPELIPCFNFNQHTKHHCFDVYEHIAVSVSNVPKKEILRMAMLLHDIGKPQCFRTDENGCGHFKGHPAVSAKLSDAILSRLKLSTADRQLIVSLIKEHDNRFLPQKKAVLRFLSHYDEQFLKDQIAIRRADTLSQSLYMRQEKLKLLTDTEKIVENISKEKSCFKLCDLKINGNDLLSQGFENGHIIGDTLRTILLKVIDGEIDNDRNTLLSYSQTILNSSHRQTKQEAMDNLH